MAGWSPLRRVCVHEFNSMSYTCTRAHTRRIASVRSERGDAVHVRTPTRGVTGKGGLVGETTGSATPRSWQLFPRWADRSAGRIQPSRAPSIMAPFSSFPYLRQHGWHGFLSLLGPILRHEHTPCRLSFSMDWMTSGLHSVERWRSEPQRHRRYTAGRRSKSDRQGRGDRHAKLLRRSVTRYTTLLRSLGLRNCARVQYVSFDIWQGQQGFRLLPKHLDFPTAPLLHARTIINPSLSWSTIYRSYALFLCEYRNKLFLLTRFFLWFFLWNEIYEI